MVDAKSLIDKIKFFSNFFIPSHFCQPSKEHDEFQHKYSELQKRFILTEGKVEDLNELKQDLENQLNELKETHKFALQENTQLRHDLVRSGFFINSIFKKYIFFC